MHWSPWNWMEKNYFLNTICFQGSHFSGQLLSCYDKEPQIIWKNKNKNKSQYIYNTHS